MECLKIVVRKQDGDSDLHVFGKHGSRRDHIQGLEFRMSMSRRVHMVTRTGSWHLRRNPIRPG